MKSIGEFTTFEYLAWTGILPSDSDRLCKLRVGLFVGTNSTILSEEQLFQDFVLKNFPMLE